MRNSDFERLRGAQSKALRIIDAHLAKRFNDVGLLGAFGDGLLSRYFADVVDHLHHGAIDGIAQHAFHETAVDLHVVDGQVPEISERRNSESEIIEGEPEADFPKRVNEALRDLEVSDRAGLGELEADELGPDVMGAKLLAQEIAELGVAEGRS